MPRKSEQQDKQDKQDVNVEMPERLSREELEQREQDALKQHANEQREAANERGQDVDEETARQLQESNTEWQRERMANDFAAQAMVHQTVPAQDRARTVADRHGIVASDPGWARYQAQQDFESGNEGMVPRMDETVPGGVYLVGSTYVNAEGQPVPEEYFNTYRQMQEQALSHAQQYEQEQQEMVMLRRLASVFGKE